MASDAEGGRGFLREVGIVVLGVLLALGAQQAAEWLDWREQGRAAIAAMGTELLDSRLAADERIRAFYCVDRRLDELAEVVDVAARTGRLPPLGTVSMPPSRNWTTGTWTSVQTSELAGHLPTRQRNAYAAVYNEVAILAAKSEEETGLWVELQQLSGPGRPLDPGEARALRLAIGRARFANRYIGLISAQFLADLRNFGVALPAAESLAAEYAASYAYPLAARPLCRRLGRIGAPHYGQAPWADAVPQIVRQPGDTGPPPAPPYPKP